MRALIERNPYLGDEDITLSVSDAKQATIQTLQQKLSQSQPATLEVTPNGYAIKPQA
jgi:hypothetical protein